MRRVVAILFASALGLSMARAQARRPDDTAANSLLRDTIDLGSISVFGNPGKESDRSARALERNAPQILSVTGSETIERAADLTVTDAALRMGGLSVIRGNAGEDSKLIIRGMSPKYNTTLVDGVDIPSPDDRNRDIRLDLFPADLTRRVEVYKSLTPDLEGSGIGGLVNIVLKDAAPDPVLAVQTATGYGGLYLNRTQTTFDRSVVQHEAPAQRLGPNYYATGADFTKSNLSFGQARPLPDLLGGLTYSRRFDRGKIGMVLAGDYQAFHHGSDGFYMAAADEPGLNNAAELTDFYTRSYSATTFRQSAYNQWDLQVNSRNKLSLFSFYTHQLDAEARLSTDTSLDEGRTGPGTGRIDLLERSRLHIQDIFNSTLSGAHRLGDAWTLRWAASWARASGRYPDWAELDASTGRLRASGDSITQTPLYLGPLQRQWLSNTEQQQEGKASVSWTPAFLKDHVALEAGMGLRSMQRTNYYTSYTFVPALDANGTGQPFLGIYQARWLDNNGPEDPLGTGANPNTYTAREDIGAGFAAARLHLGKFDWVGGLRGESTYQEVTSSVNPALSYGQHVGIRYRDWLPSLQGRYALDKANLLRLSYFKGLARPALSDVTFFSLEEEDYVIAGNPFLVRTRADNLDLRFEHDRAGGGTWQAGLFYKHLLDPFEKTMLNQGDTLYPIPQNGLPYTPAGELTEQFKNYPDATNYGAELQYTLSWGKWGGTASYTLTISQVTQVTKFQTRADPQNPASNIETVSRSETRPLEGQSRHLGSLCIWYKDRRRWTGQVSFVYTGSRISDVSGWYGLDQWQRGFALLDVAAERKVGRRFSIFGKASNLLNAPTVTEIRQPNPDAGTGFLPDQGRGDRITVQRMQNGVQFLLGARWGI